MVSPENGFRYPVAAQGGDPRPLTPPMSDGGYDKSQSALLVKSPRLHHASAMSFSANREYLQMHQSGRSYSFRDEMPRVNVFKQGSLYSPQVCCACYVIVSSLTRTFMLAGIRRTGAACCCPQPHLVVLAMTLFFYIQVPHSLFVTLCCKGARAGRSTNSSVVE